MRCYEIAPCGSVPYDRGRRECDHRCCLSTTLVVALGDPETLPLNADHSVHRYPPPAQTAMDNGQALPLHNVHVVNFDERVKRDARPPWPQRIWTVIHCAWGALP